MARAASGATYGVIAIMRSGAGRIRGAPMPADVCFRTFFATNSSSFSFLAFFLHFFAFFALKRENLEKERYFSLIFFCFFCYCCFLTAFFQATKATFGATYVPFILVAATQLITGTAATFAMGKNKKKWKCGIEEKRRQER